MHIVLEPDQEIIPYWVSPGFGKVGEGGAKTINCDVKFISSGRFPCLGCCARRASAAAINVQRVRLEYKLGRVLAFPWVATVRGAHWASSSNEIGREVMIRVARRGAIASVTTASSGTTLPVASRRARERITVVTGRTGRACKRVGGWAQGQFNANDPGVVTREEGEIGGHGSQVV